MPKRSTRKNPLAPQKAWFPRIKKLTPRGFLSFAPDFPGVELGNLNVFVGANGSGKSNLFEAARFLQEAQRNVRGFLTSSSEVKDWLWSDSRGWANAAQVEVVVEGDVELSYQLGFGQSGNADVEFLIEVLEFARQPADEKLFWRSGSTVANFFVQRKFGRRVEKEPVGASNTVLDALRHPTDESVMRSMRESLASMSFFAEWGFGRRTNILRSTRASATVQSYLLEDGSNAPLRFNTLLQQRGFRERLLRHITTVMPNVDDALAEFVMGSTQIVFMESSRARRTPASRLSDGTLHWLVLGLILLDEESHSPLFLDEPELGLHPDAIRSLGDLLRSASTRRQIIVNTHSSLLVSAFSDQPECVYAFDRDERGTRVERVNSKLIASWQKRGESLGEIWAAGAIGGNRW
ncbi:MAG: AAA family ATPase [Archangiaceae bacterium]|nr:AAA family ATPase [Archangiaceae bacterium]